LAKPYCASFVYKLGNQWEWVRIPNRPLVQATIVLDGSELPILLLDEEERCGIRALGGTDVTFSGMFNDEFL